MLHIHGHVEHIGPIKQIFIINLPYHSDQRTSSIALMQTLDFDAFIVLAYTVQSPEIVSRISLTRHYRITLVELACWASHMQIWTNIITSENSNSWTLIFEDDINLEMVTYEVLESLSRDLWNQIGMIYLGYCDNPGWLYDLRRCIWILYSSST